jgi:hypothetical protein
VWGKREEGEANFVAHATRVLPKKRGEPKGSSAPEKTLLNGRLLKVNNLPGSQVLFRSSTLLLF